MESNFEQKITEQIAQSLAKKIDDIFIEGLRLKGYVFEDRNELEWFIKYNCQGKKIGNQTTYYINQEAFLLYIDNLDFNIDFQKEPLTISAEAGHYKFL